MSLRTDDLRRRYRASVLVAGVMLAIAGYCCAADNLCGVRAVSRVLAHHGKEADLIELLDEFPKDCRESGASVAEVADVLRKHGLHVAVVRGSGGDVPCIDPAICWTQVAGTPLGGHFYAILPSKKGMYSVWDGYPDASRRFANSDANRVFVIASRSHDSGIGGRAAVVVAVVIQAILGAIAIQAFSNRFNHRRKAKCTDSR